MVSSAVSRYVGQAARTQRTGNTDNKPVVIGFPNLRDIVNRGDIERKSHDITEEKQVQRRLLFIALLQVKPNTHRRRRRDSTLKLRRVGGVNAPVGSRDPVYNCVRLSDK